MLPDYSGQNLQGRSFKGQNLTGANFSTADIRGADFTNALLRDADFTDAKAGLQERWVLGLLIVTFLLSALSGFLLVYGGSVIQTLSSLSNPDEFIVGIVFLVIVTVFYIVTIRNGLRAGANALAGAIVILVILVLNRFPAAGVLLAFYYATSLALAYAVVLVLVLAAAVTVAVAETLAVAIAGALTGIITGLVAIVLTLAAFYLEYTAIVIFLPLAGVVVLVIFINAYIGRRSLADSKTDSLVRSFAIAFAAIGGTSFRGANLTDANFTGATLKNTDFRTANLTRTRFDAAKKLDLARLGNTIKTNYR